MRQYRVLRTIFGLTRQEVIGDWRKLYITVVQSYMVRRRGEEIHSKC